jgi:hypothetical protein
MIPLVTTRFNDYTWDENENYRKKNNIIGGIYPVPQMMSPKIYLDSLVFIIEMNNTKNRIEGIGLIRNRIETDKYYKVYEERNFNRFVYKTNYRIDRNIIEEYNKTLVEILDYILFKERTHLKRGSGITSVPEKLLIHEKCNKINLKEEIKTIFIKYFDKKCM